MPSTSRPFLFPDAFPFQFGNFFEEALEFLVIVHRLSDAGFPWLGNAELSRLATVALDQIQGGVQLAAGAVTGSLAALASAHRQGSAQQPVVVSQLGEANANLPQFEQSALQMRRPGLSAPIRMLVAESLRFCSPARTAAAGRGFGRSG